VEARIEIAFASVDPRVRLLFRSQTPVVEPDASHPSRKADIPFARRMVSKARRRFQRSVKKYTTQFIHHLPNGPNPDVLPGFRFYAVLGTWMEEDIVESTVRNAFAQGAEKVFLVDNASTDATVERAVAAGATLAERYRTISHNEEVRILFMNAVVARESMASDADHVWWLWLDADEFPEGPDGMTIAQYLGTLDRRFRTVGSTYYTHFPTTKPETIRGIHPVDLQPMCEKYVSKHIVTCAQSHYKHPLQRFDRHDSYLMSHGGFHYATLGNWSRLFEPDGGIVTHHIYYQNEAVSRHRLDLINDPVRNAHKISLGRTEIIRRRKNLDAVYSQRWDEVDSLQNYKPEYGVHPTPWTQPGTRWYGPEALDGQRSSGAAPGSA
jgi:hypothetical protein